MKLSFPFSSVLTPNFEVVFPYGRTRCHHLTATRFICILTKLIKISYLKDKMKVMINEIIRKKYGKFQNGSFGKKTY